MFEDIKLDPIGKRDRLLTSINLLTVTAVKRKYLDQIIRYGFDNLPESIAVAGWYDHNGFEFVLFGHGENTLASGRIEIHNYAVRILRDERPELFERSEDQETRSKEYDKEREEVENQVILMKTMLPQLFTT